MGADINQTSREVAEAFLLDSAQRGKLFEFARGRFGIASQDAEDLIQDTALELLRHSAVVQSPEGLVFTVFRARCVRFVSSHRKRAEVAHEDFCDDARQGENPARIETRIALREALGEISSACRRILSAYYIEGQSLNESAHSMAVASSGVFKIINRCLKRLRACLN